VRPLHDAFQAGYYHFDEFEKRDRNLPAGYQNERGVWYGCLTAGLDGKIAHFDGQTSRATEDISRQVAAI